jgi:hypothetical protein
LEQQVPQASGQLTYQVSSPGSNMKPIFQLQVLYFLFFSWFNKQYTSQTTQLLATIYWLSTSHMLEIQRETEEQRIKTGGNVKRSTVLLFSFSSFYSEKYKSIPWRSQCP